MHYRRDGRVTLCGVSLAGKTRLTGDEGLVTCARCGASLRKVRYRDRLADGRRPG